MKSINRLFATAAVCVALPLPALATPIGFTDPNQFLAAIGAMASLTENFDARPTGQVIDEGATLGALTYQYDLQTSFGVSMQVRDDFDTTSGSNALGTDDAGVFQEGDAFTLAFDPANAFGLFFILSDPAAAGEISLTAGGATVANDGMPAPLADGGLVYFIGIVDAMATFGSAAIDFPLGPAGNFLFTVDDITIASVVAVPDPTLPALLGVGALMLLRRRLATHR